MKNIEEKAKAYDSIIEKANKMHSENCEACQACIEELIPELAESEDEKIRKWIVDDITFNMNNEPLNNLEYRKKAEKAIAWLEKQGEQKVSVVDFKAKDWYVSKVDGKIHNAKFMEKTPTNQARKLEIEKAAMSATGIIEQEEWFIKGAEWSDKNPSYISSEKQREQKPNPYTGVSFEYNGHIWGMCTRDNGVDILYDKHLIKHLEKQGEKKPIDETPYPETFEKAIDLYYYSYGNGKGEFEHLSLEKFRDIVYTFVSNYGQKPVEWSEEDEVKINRIVACLENLNVTDNDILLKDIDWLQSLQGRVQPKQEWSKEDEEHIDSLLKRLDALCRNKIERTRFAISEDRDWLKSLRPQNQWKPSDEQMEALDWQVENTSVTSWQYKATKELLEDLKKLKEE